MAENASSDEIVRPRRAQSALADMVRSLGLIVVIIAVLLLIGPARALIFPGADRMAPVDYSGYVRGFDARAGASAVMPASLPDGWRANAGSLHHTPDLDQLHVGWAVPGERFAGLDEGTGDRNALLLLVVGRSGAAVRGDTTIAGESWQVRRSDRGETVYTRTVNGVLVIVTGNASDDELRTLAASLR